ncbi:MAG: hypothetical protein A3E08_03050 [Candidatus Wildermuthbacteria bacterium RIFCSPHIGHO2_12_FULL_49_13]|nr:MAG: hypothetical protein A3E08_03050 [Candidatus Wildermuthbacteria bacterium RIFCSPHIGHO2_12_FULL_49_13]
MREEFLFCSDGCVRSACIATGAEQHNLCEREPDSLVKFFERSLPVTDEKEALRQAMEAIFYERDAGETPPPNLRILEKSRFPHEDRGEEESAAPGACY